MSTRTASPPLDVAALEAVSQPLAWARQLPAAAYLDPWVLATERERIFGAGWVGAGLDEGLERPGSFVLVPMSASGVLLTRGADLELRALDNLCVHRGVPIVDAPCGRVDALVCPYHGWVYELDGRRRVTTGAGAPAAAPPVRLRSRQVQIAHRLLFVGPVGHVEPLAPRLEGLDEVLRGRLPARLALAERTDRLVRANWKLLIENFVESLHFASVHPALERLTPSRSAATILPKAPDARWLGGTMDLIDGVDTVSPDGGLNGRPSLRRDPGDRKVHDVFVWPNLMLSLQPDYLLIYRVYPVDEGATRVLAERYVHPAAPRGSVEPILRFWAEVDAEDQRICEAQQRVMVDRREAGAFTDVEESVHAFDAWVARVLLDAVRGG